MLQTTLARRPTEANPRCWRAGLLAAVLLGAAQLATAAPPAPVINGPPPAPPAPAQASPAPAPAPAASPPAAAEAAADTRGLDQDIQGLKKDVVDLNKDLFILEEELLFPANTQVAVLDRKSTRLNSSHRP